MTKMLRAIPVLPSTNVAESLAFVRDTLGFKCWTWDDPPTYGGAALDGAELHFSSTDRKEICAWTSCRVDVDDVQAIYERAKAAGVVHPNGDLGDKPWGYREFAVLDPAGILITFGQDIDEKD
ncbi:bleomycin resistance protein [Hyphobacterium marinum]|uniref:Bleomycin resistance protein n=1 Tax=Hyphobacterium marinum TaxID=3116574 RepID=A0ABU7LZP9_9PROT|nr:VOC family protein [Hyphobacterium sp. Y6023]MEE2567018.1 VOC family protein [Hyphobacterium sp. Y6023]